LIGLLALAMGGQNAVVRRLAVPDLTTTVLTLTVTGLVADTTASSVRGRRLISVLAMLAGALTGGVLLRWVALAAPLWLAQYCWSPAHPAPIWRSAAHNRRPGGSPRPLSRRSYPRAKSRRWLIWRSSTASSTAATSGLHALWSMHWTPEWPDQPGGSEAGSDTGGAVAAVGLGKLDIEERHDRSPWLLGMIVRPDNRSSGFVRLLLSHLEQWARAHG
jgi:hypothetical protein